MQSAIIERCRLCGGTDFQEILDLGDIASSGRFPYGDEPDPPSGRLRMVFCAACGLAQLDRNFDLRELYKPPYGYRSGINRSMRDHLKGIVGDIIASGHVKSGDLVLDIASNDGTLLNAYGDLDISRIGMDPTIGQFVELYPKDITAIPEFFGAEAFLAASGGRKAAVITTIAMLYDLPDPHSFVSDVARCLGADGIWVFEQSYAGLMLARNAFDTICHEHLEYYGLRQIERLLDSHDLRAVDVTFNEINGGSFQVKACHQAAALVAAPGVKMARAQETAMNLNSPAPYLAFRDKVGDIRNLLQSFVEAEHRAGKTFCLYGASTKGNTLLQSCGLDHSLIDAAADRNPKKWGYRTPRTGIPIISEETVRAMEPNYLLVLPWHFKDEFVEREQDFLRAGGKMIFPLPEFTIVTAENLA